ncbi:MAG TPA: hypothetical protein DEH25_04710, partial [Chloroflexi bacterium]|nr:hypothetical protein [Chloroflexota bacterium]
MSSQTSLSPYLVAFRRRLRLRDGWLLAQRTLWLALASTLAILLFGRFVPISTLALWAWGLPLLLWLCAVIGYSILRSQPLPRVARRIDLELGLKERLSTASE